VAISALLLDEARERLRGTTLGGYRREIFVRYMQNLQIDAMFAA
jgi:hypothetical protein